jgi:hypothetical protein
MSEKKFDFSYPLTDLEKSLPDGWLDNWTVSKTDANGNYNSSHERVIPHPDGQPWPKCCCHHNNGDPTQCAYVDKYKDTGLNRFDQGIVAMGGEESQIGRVYKQGGRFFCAHRNDNGYSRVCHGWAVRDGGGWQGTKKDVRPQIEPPGWIDPAGMGDGHYYLTPDDNSKMIYLNIVPRFDLQFITLSDIEFWQDSKEKECDKK